MPPTYEESALGNNQIFLTEGLVKVRREQGKNKIELYYILNTLSTFKIDLMFSKRETKKKYWSQIISPVG